MSMSHCVHVRACACMCVHVRVFVHARVCAYACACVRMYVRACEIIHGTFTGYSRDPEGLSPRAPAVLLLLFVEFVFKEGSG